MKIRLGTRKSPLAVWQTNFVADCLKKNNLNLNSETIEISSEGDKNLSQPLYSFGITGVFTKSLDQALLNKKIDVAVHSLKDIPTELAKGLEIVAVLQRDYNQDIMVLANGLDFDSVDWQEAKVATGSLRRRAFLSHQYPGIQFEEIRGNVQTRLKKINELGVEGTVLSKAGIERMNIELNTRDLDFMLPSVGQGCIALVARCDENQEIKELLSPIGDRKTEQITSLERSFLNTLEGGCTAPIGIRVWEEGKKLFANASLLSTDGKKRIDENNFEIDLSNPIAEGKALAQKILEKGGKELMQEIKKEIKKID